MKNYHVRPIFDKFIFFGEKRAVILIIL